MKSTEETYSDVLCRLLNIEDNLEEIPRKRLSSKQWDDLQAAFKCHSTGDVLNKI